MLISRSEKFVSLVIIIVLNLPSISIRCSLISLQPTRFTSEENCLFISSKLAEGRAHTCWASVYSVKRYNLCPESQMRRLSFCFDSRQQPKKIDLSSNFLPTFKHFVQENILETGNKFEIRMNRYYVTSNESKSKNAGSSFFFSFFLSIPWLGNWKLEARIPINIFCLNFVSIVWTSNEIKYCPALTMNVKNNRGWCRNFKLDLMKYTRNISVNFSMGMDWNCNFHVSNGAMDLHKKNVTKFYFRTLTSSLQSNIFLTLENYGQNNSNFVYSS